MAALTDVFPYRHSEIVTRYELSPRHQQDPGLPPVIITPHPPKGALTPSQSEADASAEQGTRCKLQLEGSTSHALRAHIDIDVDTKRPDRNSKPRGNLPW
ncbi:hypothetical protein BV22DRAFT_1032432 [Leucogyrophana mollusca]|uniref:Uncharacterized protein n=1 Tax=Leucogyrophana mollusca TaxID=85980 RepID=A0ACB8BPM0_9AGAM|nr:hypothetical protein BV22DRAFT_1032432 [Leucogyrophana mollusca]